MTSVAVGRRVMAASALALGAIAAAVSVAAAIGDIGRLIALPALFLAGVFVAWIAVTRTGTIRATAVVAVGVLLLVVATAILTAEGHGLGAVAVLGLLAGAAALSRKALGPLLAAPHAQRHPVGPAQRGVLIMNLKSGGGKAERFGLVDACHDRGIEPVVLQPDDDLSALAQDAIDNGADVVGMAGGDGSQALVAAVAMRADVAMVCVPAGTRNHFALDLGLDRDDVVGALDAFGDAVERRIDLAMIGDRVFVNNVSLGVYAKVVQSPDYRDAKRETTASMLPELLGPDSEAFDLHFVGPDGTDYDDPVLVQVSNNPYVLTSLAGFGSRPRLDTGALGIASATIAGPAEAAAFVAASTAGQLQRFPGWAEWTAPTFTVESSQPVEAGVDGEALVLTAPLEFRSVPGAVRVRIPTSAPGRSPAARARLSPWQTLRALGRTAVGAQVGRGGGEGSGPWP